MTGFHHHHSSIFLVWPHIIVSSCFLFPGSRGATIFVSATPLILWVPLPSTIFKDRLCKLSGAPDWHSRPSTLWYQGVFDE